MIQQNNQVESILLDFKDAASDLRVCPPPSHWQKMREKEETGLDRSAQKSAKGTYHVKSIFLGKTGIAKQLILF